MADEVNLCGRQIAVLYGSETGTAREVAERIGREAKRRYFPARVIALDDYNVVSSVVSGGLVESSFEFYSIHL